MCKTGWFYIAALVQAIVAVFQETGKSRLVVAGQSRGKQVLKGTHMKNKGSDSDLL